MQFNSNNNGNRPNNIPYNQNVTYNYNPSQVPTGYNNQYGPVKVSYNQNAINNMKKQKKKTKVVKKVVVGSIAGLVGTMILATTMISAPLYDFINNDRNGKSTYSSDESAYVYVDDSYSGTFGDFSYTNEVSLVEGMVSNTYIKPKSFDVNSITNFVELRSFDYTYLHYYALDNALALYRDSEYNKEVRNNILSSNGKIDADKLHNIVKQNNYNYMNGGVNSVNCFLTEMEDSKIKDMCTYIADYYNNSEGVDYLKLAYTLNHLKIFVHSSTSANAYVNDELILVINPNMINLMEDMLEMRGSIEEGYDIEDSVLAHELEHILQHSSNDFNEVNGLEIGPFRKYDNLSVNSLWVSWLLEGAADINSADKLNIDPYTYLKKIGYFNTYTLSRIFDSNYDTNALLNSTYAPNLSTAYSILNLNDEQSQRDFLELIYSIELTQSSCNDFWTYYESQTGTTLDDNEKLIIKKQIREEAIMKLTLNYYKGLANAINNGTITNLETAFYFMRMWELDCYNHLEYSYNAEGYEVSKDFVIWLDELNGVMCEGLASGIGSTKEEVEEKYKNYHMNVNENGVAKDNCNIGFLSNDKKEFIDALEESFAFNSFAKISDVADGITYNGISS